MRPDRGRNHRSGARSPRHCRRANGAVSAATTPAGSSASARNAAHPPRPPQPAERRPATGPLPARSSRGHQDRRPESLADALPGAGQQRARVRQHSASLSTYTIFNWPGGNSMGDIVSMPRPANPSRYPGLPAPRAGQPGNAPSGPKTPGSPAPGHHLRTARHRPPQQPQVHRGAILPAQPERRRPGPRYWASRIKSDGAKRVHRFGAENARGVAPVPPVSTAERRFGRSDPPSTAETVTCPISPCDLRGSIRQTTKLQRC